jgi:hypothetical protein
MKTETITIKKLFLRVKPTLVILISLILEISGAKAQQFHAGLYGGINVTDVEGTHPNGTSAGFQKFGFTIGSYVNTAVSANNILQMEIGYSQKGYLNEPDGTHKNNYSQLNLNYIEAALLLRHRIHFRLWNKPRDKFDLEGGVSMGKLIYNYYTVQSIEYPIDLNTTDISPFIGIAYNYSRNVGLEFRYYNSITTVITREASNDSHFLYYGSWNRGDNSVFQFKLKITIMGRNR